MSAKPPIAPVVSGKPSTLESTVFIASNLLCGSESRPKCQGQIASADPKLLTDGRTDRQTNVILYILVTCRAWFGASLSSQCEQHCCPGLPLFRRRSGRILSLASEDSAGPCWFSSQSLSPDLQKSFSLLHRLSGALSSVSNSSIYISSRCSEARRASRLAFFLSWLQLIQRRRHQYLQ